MTPDEKRAYDRARYAAKRDEILARRRAAYAENRDANLAKNRAYYEQNRQRILEQQKERRSAPEIREERLAYFRAYGAREDYKALRRRRYALARYGTETLPERPKKEKPWRPASTPKARTASTTIESRPSRSPAQTKNTPTPSSATAAPASAGSETSKASSTTASASPSKPPWTPTPISRWEKGLEYHATPI